jgi:hypothetical protein
MDAAVQTIIERGWSIDSTERPSFDEIFSVLESIEFRLSGGVDSVRVHEFMSLVGCRSGASGADAFKEGRPANAPEGIAVDSQPNETERLSERQLLSQAEGIVDAPSRERSKLLIADWELPVHRREFPCLFERRKTRQKMGWGLWSKEVEVEVDEAIGPLDGIIAHLTRECGGNVDEHRLVRVAGSSVCCSDAEFAAKNAVDLGSDSVFYSGPKPEQWLCYDFSDMVLIPTHYSIRAGGELGPRNWVVEGRKCDADWLELDRREKNDSLKGKNVTVTFPVSQSVEVYEIRLRQTGRNHHWKHCLVVSSFEVFGSLVRTIRWREFPRELAKGNEFLSKATRVGRFPPLVKKRTCCGGRFDVPDGIIAHLTRECGGNVHDHHIVEVTSSKPLYDSNESPDGTVDPNLVAAKNVADLGTCSCFVSAFRAIEGDIPHTRNNWVCYDFKERRIVPTHCAIRTYYGDLGDARLKSWLVETSADGESWREVARQEDNRHLNGKWFTGTFAVAGGGECRFIRLVNIGSNHFGDDQLNVSAWEIFGGLIE